MTVLLSCQSVSKAYGPRTLFRDLSMTLFEGDQVGLIGPNGSGKSTLLKILSGKETADSGQLSVRRGLVVGYVPQSCEFEDLSCEQILKNALDESMPEYEKVHLAEKWLSKMGFTGKEPSAARLSGGWKKRLRLALELIHSPDLLLLDEPTNHLDVEGILWLEKFLSREAPSFLLVSHDRYFLQNAVKKVIEIDPTYPKGIFTVDGRYAEFLERKETFLEGQLQQERSAATKARRETAWLRQGAKARTTKSQSRIDSAQEILEQHADLRSRNQQKKAKLSFAATERETRKLLAVKNVSKSIEGRLLFNNLDFTLSPGTRLGLMGPNGAGKTTLLRLLAKEVEPDVGTIKPAEGLQIVYFDQHRAQLPLNISLREALSPKGDYVTFRGEQVHVNGWCKRFLFSPNILDLPIGKLSGGERARISIAHLMLQPADLLLLDEPTNDLDIPTLETLEESLIEFPGALVLITHDRCMLDRLCNLFLALGNPACTELLPEYAQWEAAYKANLPSEKPKEKKEPIARVKPKLSYHEKKEYDQIEANISKLEAEVGELNRLLEQAEIAENPQRLSGVCSAIGLLENQIEQLYLRWQELDQKSR